MGAGNYYTNAGKFIYIELDYTEDYELNCMQFDDLVGEIRDLLPKSYSPCLKWGQEGQIIAENSLCDIALVDNNCYKALVFSYEKLYSNYADNLVPLAERHISQVADKVFDSIAENYPCFERICSWTSKKYEKRKIA